MKKENGGILKWAAVGILGVFVLGMFALGHDDENAVTGAIAQKIDAMFNGTTTTISLTVPTDTTKQIVVPQKATTGKVTTAKKPTTTRKVTTAKKATTTTKRIVVTNRKTQEFDYVLNTNTRRFHTPHCRDLSRMSKKNWKDYHGTHDEVVAMGYTPCSKCNP